MSMDTALSATNLQATDKDAGVGRRLFELHQGDCDGGYQCGAVSAGFKDTLNAK